MATGAVHHWSSALANSDIWLLPTACSIEPRPGPVQACASSAVSFRELGVRLSDCPCGWNRVSAVILGEMKTKKPTQLCSEESVRSWHSTLRLHLPLQAPALSPRESRSLYSSYASLRSRELRQTRFPIGLR